MSTKEEGKREIVAAFDPSTRFVGWAILDVTAPGKPTRILSGVIEGKGGTRHGRYASISWKAR